MTDESPVSAIIPVYNGEKYLAEALESILAQTSPASEIVVVDDGSTDNTAAIARAHEHVIYTRQSRQGPAAARNAGFRMARGELIGFLDADDLWPPDKLGIQVSRLNEDPSLEAVMGRARYIEMPGAPEIDIQFEGPDNTLANNHLGCGLFRRSAFEKVGLFDESLRYCEDFDWFLRAREQDLPFTIMKQITLHYRIHDQNMTHHDHIGNPYLVKALKKSLERRRNSGQGDVQQLPGWFDFCEARRKARPQA